MNKKLKKELNRLKKQRAELEQIKEEYQKSFEFELQKLVELKTKYKESLEQKIFNRRGAIRYVQRYGKMSDSKFDSIINNPKSIIQTRVKDPKLRNMIKAEKIYLREELDIQFGSWVLAKAG